jgi:hypothetical protein
VHNNKQTKSKVLPYGLYTSLSVPMKPWVDIFMNFVLGLPMSKKGGDSIFMVVDRFSKTHFISCHKINNTTNMVDLFFREITQLHRVPKIITFDHDVKFLSLFWKNFWGKLRTTLLFSTTCHPWING